jgi:putative DNA primase/helicase
MTKLRPDPEVIRRFLDVHGLPTQIVVIDPELPEGHKDKISARLFSKPEAAIKWIVDQNKRRNCYFTVNELAPTAQFNRKPKKTDIGRMTWAHADADPQPGETPEHCKARVLASLQEFKPPPSLVIDSGGGINSLWRIAEPVAINGHLPVLEGINLAIAEALRADHCHDICRILRCPGTVNLPGPTKRAKGRTPALATLVYAGPEAYSLEELPPPIKTRVRTTAAAEAGAGDDGAGLPPIGELGEIPQLARNDFLMPLIKRGEHPDRSYKSRSEALFAAVCGMIRAGLGDNLIAAVILCDRFHISESVLEKGDPRAYAFRQIANAHEKVGQDDSAAEHGPRGKDPLQAKSIHEAVIILAAMDPLTYEGHREGVAEKFELKRLSALDEAVKAARKKADGDEDEDAFGWKVEPATHAVDGARLADEVEAVMRRYVILPKHAAAAAALWVLHAWTYDHSDVSPTLMFTSPDMRCGKSTALKVVMGLVPKPLSASSITTSATFRAIDAWAPTLGVDEADTFLRNNEELRGVLNASHAKGGLVVRSVEANGDFKVKPFSTWCPKVIAAIGALAPTLMDRSIVIAMKRKLAGEKVERLREASKPELFAVLKGRCARWAADHGLKLDGAEPTVPATLNDRAGDNWRPLLAIADIIGGAWPTKARAAAEALAGDALGDAESTKTMLLSDIRDIFGDQKVMASAVLCGRLVLLEGRPWPEFGKARKPLSPTQLARLLSPFGVTPMQVKPDGVQQVRGYESRQFDDAFGRYLPSKVSNCQKPASDEAFNADSEVSNEADFDTLENARKTHEHSTSDTLTLRNPSPGGKAMNGNGTEGYRALDDDEFPPIDQEAGQ